MASFDPAQAARETAAELSAGWGVNNEPRVMSTLQALAKRAYAAGVAAERNRTKQALAFIERGHRYDCDFYISRDTIPCTCGYEKARAVFQEETKPREVPE